MGELQNHVAPQGFDCFPADGEVLPAELCHTPQHETDGHRKRFAGSDGAIADQRVIVLVLVIIPPAKSCQLLFTEGFVMHLFTIFRAFLDSL